MSARVSSLTTLVAFVLAATTGCTSEKKPEGPARPVRFAVIAAPEVGASDDDLAAAIGKLSREPDLDFVLVPGPLLARDADANALDNLKNDLGQLAPPVYVGFASVGSSASTLRGEDILVALEKMGPGEDHAVVYARTPPRQPDVIVNVLGPDGKGKLEKPQTGKHVVQLGAGENADLVVLTGERTELAKGPTLTVAPLTKSKGYVLVTIYSMRIEVQPIALEGPNPPSLEYRTPPQ